MNNEKSTLSFSHDYDIIQPEREKAYPIPVSDWDFLRNKVNRIQSSNLLYHTIGSVLLGISGSAFIAALTLPKALEQIGESKIIIWSIFCVSLFGGIISLYYAYQKRQDLTCTKDDVVQEMDRLKTRFEIKKSKQDIY